MKEFSRGQKDETQVLKVDAVWPRIRLHVIVNTFLIHSRFMVTESYDYKEVDKTMMYYGTSLVKESDFPFNFYLLDLPQNTSGLWVQHLVQLWMDNMPEGQWANWLVSQDTLSLHPISLTFLSHKPKS